RGRIQKPIAQQENEACSFARFVSGGRTSQSVVQQHPTAFRAGIQSIEKGQIEAARSLGMNYLQTLSYVVLPQAIRRVLPPLGNDFVAMIKDSSLVAILGVNDLTQLAKVLSGASFRYLETYTTVALIYLSMTIVGSLLVRYIERRVTIDS